MPSVVFHFVTSTSSLSARKRPLFERPNALTCKTRFDNLIVDAESRGNRLGNMGSHALDLVPGRIGGCQLLLETVVFFLKDVGRHEKPTGEFIGLIFQPVVPVVFHNPALELIEVGELDPFLILTVKQEMP